MATPAVSHINPAAGVNVGVGTLCVGCAGSLVVLPAALANVSTIGAFVSNTVVGGPTGLLALPTGLILGLPVGPIVF